MVHTGRAFGPWIVTSVDAPVDDWKTFAKDEKQGRTLVSYSKWKCPRIKSSSGLGLPLERTLAFQ